MTSDLIGLDLTAVAAIVAMAVVTLATRLGGFWLMGHVTITPRVERFLRHMAGGVLIAIVTAAAMNGDRAMWAGLAAAIAVMLILRRPMTAVAIGMLTAIVLRYLSF